MCAWGETHLVGRVGASTADALAEAATSVVVSVGLGYTDRLGDHRSSHGGRAMAAEACVRELDDRRSKIRYRCAQWSGPMLRSSSS